MSAHGNLVRGYYRRTERERVFCAYARDNPAPTPCGVQCGGGLPFRYEAGSRSTPARRSACRRRRLRASSKRRAQTARKRPVAPVTRAVSPAVAASVVPCAKRAGVATKSAVRGVEPCVRVRSRAVEYFVHIGVESKCHAERSVPFSYRRVLLCQPREV